MPGNAGKLELLTYSVFFGQYFLVFTVLIPKENSVGIFSIVDTKKYVFTVSK